MPTAPEGTGLGEQAVHGAAAGSALQPQQQRRRPPVVAPLAAELEEEMRAKARVHREEARVSEDTRQQRPHAGAPTRLRHAARLKQRRQQQRTTEGGGRAGSLRRSHSNGLRRYAVTGCGRQACASSSAICSFIRGILEKAPRWNLTRARPQPTSCSPRLSRFAFDILAPNFDSVGSPESATNPRVIWT